MGKAFAGFAIATILAGAACLPSACGAQEPSGEPSPTRGALWATSTAADQQRAGNPQRVKPHAKPSRTRAYGGYFVGGGAAVHGDGRHTDTDGTWGWDYPGWVLPRIIALDWHHGRRNQGGQGAYKTDH